MQKQYCNKCGKEIINDGFRIRCEDCEHKYNPTYENLKRRAKPSFNGDLGYLQHNIEYLKIIYYDLRFSGVISQKEYADLLSITKMYCYKMLEEKLSDLNDIECWEKYRKEQGLDE